MKKTFLLLLLLKISNLFAQDNSIALLTGYNNPALVYSWNSSIQSNLSSAEPAFNFALSLKSRIKKRLFLCTEIGTNSTSHFVDISYVDNGIDVPGIHKWFGWYQNEKVYFSLSPEIKFTKTELFYLNAGLAFTRDLINQFTNGYESYNNQSSDLQTYTTIRNNGLGWIFNLGINPKVKNMGFILNVGYSYFMSDYVINYQPKIGISQFSFKGGVYVDLK